MSYFFIFFLIPIKKRWYYKNLGKLNTMFLKPIYYQLMKTKLSLNQKKKKIQAFEYYILTKR